MLPAMIDGIGAFRSRLIRLLAFTDFLKVSDADLMVLWPVAPPVEGGVSLLAHGPRLMLLTLGAAGAVVVDWSGEVVVAASAVHIEDTIGAGDIFSGSWLARFLELKGSLHTADVVHEATRFACLADAVACKRARAEPPSLSDLNSVEGVDGIDHPSPRVGGA